MGTKVAASPYPTKVLSQVIHKQSAMKTKPKGFASKRKPSQIPSFISSEPFPPIPDLVAPRNTGQTQSAPGQGGDAPGGAQGWVEVDTVLNWTVRVLEMVARRGKWEPQQKQLWGQIRRIAEKWERRV